MRIRHFFWTTLLLLCVLVASCQKETIPSHLTVPVGSTTNLNTSGSWKSSRTFIATVTANGLISGKHVGSCTISDNKNRCTVTVTPTTTLFKDPVTKWGVSQSYVTNQEGNDYESEDNSITYITNDAVSPARVYLFENGKLNSVGLLINITYAVDVVDHILERYNNIGERNNAFYFIDGKDLDEATTLVIYKAYNSSYYLITYADSKQVKNRSRIFNTMIL